MSSVGTCKRLCIGDGHIYMISIFDIYMISIFEIVLILCTLRRRLHMCNTVWYKWRNYAAALHCRFQYRSTAAKLLQVSKLGKVFNKWHILARQWRGRENIAMLLQKTLQYRKRAWMWAKLWRLKNDKKTITRTLNRIALRRRKLHLAYHMVGGLQL